LGVAFSDCVGVIDALVNTVDPFLGSSLSSFTFSLLFLGKTGRDTSSGFKGILSLLSVFFVSLLFLGTNSVGVRVKSLTGGVVGKWVLLSGGVEVEVSLLGSYNTLDFVRVDDLSDVWVGKERSLEVVSDLSLGGNSVGTEDLVEGLEGGLGPDDESTDLSSRSELSKVKSVDVADFNTRKVSNGLGELLALTAVYEKRTFSKLVVLSSHLLFSGSLGLAVDDSGNISVDTNSL